MVGCNGIQVGGNRKASASVLSDVESIHTNGNKQ
jgi:hypothetical protein